MSAISERSRNGLHRFHLPSRRQWHFQVITNSLETNNVYTISQLVTLGKKVKTFQLTGWSCFSGIGKTCASFNKTNPKKQYVDTLFFHIISS